MTSVMNDDAPPLVAPDDDQLSRMEESAAAIEADCQESEAGFDHAMARYKNGETGVDPVTKAQARMAAAKLAREQLRPHLEQMRMVVRNRDEAREKLARAQRRDALLVEGETAVEALHRSVIAAFVEHVAPALAEVATVRSELASLTVSQSLGGSDPLARFLNRRPNLAPLIHHLEGYAEREGR